MNYFICKNTLKVIFLFFAIQSNLFANDTVVFLNNTELIEIGKSTYRYQTDNNDLQIADILQKNYQSKFVLQDKSVFADVPSNKTYWFKFTFQNNTNEAAILDFSSSIISYIDFYAPDSLGAYTKIISTGSMREGKTKAFPMHFYWFPLSNKKKQKITYYIKISALAGVEAPLYTGTLDSLYRKKSKNDGISLLFAGAILIFVFYNICTFYVTRRRISLIYSLYLIFAAASSLMINNFCFLNYIYDTPFWHHYFILWHSPLYVFIYIFTCEYLNLKTLMKKTYYFFTTLIILLLFVTSSELYLPNTYFYLIVDVYEILVFCICITYFLISIYLLKKGHRSSIQYIIGWSAAFFSLFITVSVLRGYLPYTLFTRNVVYLGIAFEACIFTLAITNKLNLAFIKNRIFSKQSAELVIINKTKDKIFSIVSHDLRAPIATLKALLDLEDETMFSAETFAIYKSKLRQNVDGVYFTLNNLLSWSKSQMKGNFSTPTLLDLKTVVQENIHLFTNIAEDKNITLVSQLTQSYLAFADYNEICLVVRNLINNSLKFTSPQGIISISIEDVSFYWVIHIKDSGVGLSQESVKKVFNKSVVYSTSGTDGETGTGLGLQLCKEMVERNGGKINVESSLGKGSNFYFTIPKK